MELFFFYNFIRYKSWISELHALTINKIYIIGLKEKQIELKYKA